ncbi:type II toxin-antitoxin system RatA family toxin [Aquabacterium sp. OR-4]|uniref:type II toxin-antitoxin system RatA family toxin n=1 Tax=Aquabacterium sp. OR-4 TaxID=2978127 RepID=UPI0028C5588B|nr:type II toxin-antitoxin system RatA family toxin [Aquabacterium sp. OR-4]MDT7835367.1 type II toxin-antitoxin system RatA family toxin [Aquabacterium sp. OR-4]
MKHVKKSVLLWYSASEMYALVTQVEAYPAFLPWCERADLLSQDAQGPTVRLHLQFAGLRHAFTTRNIHVADQRVDMKLVDGPFSLLDGQWRFAPLGAEGQPPACKVEFELTYAFANRAFESVLSPVFDKVANTFVDSFVRRAEQVYGER